MIIYGNKQKSLFEFILLVWFLLAIIYLSVFVRLSTLDAQMILNYDPWWYYRYALEIMNNSFIHQNRFSKLLSSRKIL